MINYKISLENYKKKNIYELSDQFSGSNPEGNVISFTNYYMELNGKPFYGISGEFHFSRCEETYWEDEIIKMKMNGINIISTYVFWIHHEEERGRFRFEGRRNLRKFIKLCKKHAMYVIVRIGPFDHGEVRNGGYPDWLYGMDCEPRSLDQTYLFYVRRIFRELAGQLTGLYFKDGGPVIGAQLDNEYQHSAAGWEITTGVSEEWIPSGSDGDAYLLTIKEIARESGIDVPFYTCTGWGGAATPTEEMLPLWGGYAFWPWIFYSHKGDHPVTPEYIYRDFHNNEVPKTYNFEPFYPPESMPYLCCEMGGGMTCCYNYRFILPFESIDAMANIKIASGCNLLGYYMFKGGTNPKGEKTPFLNESQVPKLSYDYQAAIGEYGQKRLSYDRLKRIHLFAKTWEEKLCRMKTFLPDGAEEIVPADVETLRFAVRYDGDSGFIFLNNYQDHVVTKEKKDCSITIQLPKEELKISNISLAAGENAILPFEMDLEGIRLQFTTAQPLTMFRGKDCITYFFFSPKGLKPRYIFKAEKVDTIEGAFKYNKEGKVMEVCPEEGGMDMFLVKWTTSKIRIVTLTAEQSMNFYMINHEKNQLAVLTAGTLLYDGNTLRIESEKEEESVYFWPDVKIGSDKTCGIFKGVSLKKEKKSISAEVTQIGPSRYTIKIPDNYMEGVKEMLLSICYEGDIAHLFIDGDMIADNFCNGKPWETGLKLFEKRLVNNKITLCITPFKEGASINVESAMAARKEEVDKVIAGVNEIKLIPVYEYELGQIKETGNEE
nr:beta-galactosidase [uncultured Clostridium sp.]